MGAPCACAKEKTGLVSGNKQISPTFSPAREWREGEEEAWARFIKEGMYIQNCPSPSPSFPVFETTAIVPLFIGERELEMGRCCHTFVSFPFL